MTRYESLEDILLHLRYCFYSNLKRDDACITLDKTYVQTGQLSDYNEQYCWEKNIPVIKLNRLGGTLIFFKGDFAYGHYGEDAQDFTRQWRQYFVKKLKSKGLNVITSNNDVLVDNNKITGTTIMQDKMSLGLISINPDAELIRKVCLKPSDNNFEGLSKYGIDAKEVESWFMEFEKTY